MSQRIGPLVGDIRSVFRSDDRHDNSSDSRSPVVVAETSSSKETDPGVSVVCFRVGAGGVEHAFDRVRRAGHVGSAFDVRECWSHQHQQESNDADDDEQLDQRKTPKLSGSRCLGGKSVIG